MPHSPKCPALLPGLRVLDLAGGPAAFCARLLADLGAEVTRLELPGSPRLSEGPAYRYHNSGKSLLPPRPGGEEGCRSLLQLALSSDVIVESSPPGCLEGIGLGYQQLSEANPGLVMASITGFSPQGPYAKYKTSSLIASAAGGQAYVTGSPGLPPLKLRGEQPFYLASLFAACGILLALRHRQITGEGQRVGVSLQEACAGALEHVLVQYLYGGVAVQRQGSRQWNGASDIFRCLDGQVLISFYREWDILSRVIQASGVRPGEDLAAAGPSAEAVARWAAGQRAADVFALGRDMRFPWGVVQDIPSVLRDTQLASRGFFQGGAPGPVIRLAGEGEAVPHTAIGPRPPRGSAENPPLHGVRVLDFTWMLAGPYASRLLADFGAEVIKVQTARLASGAEDNSGAYFAAWNRNKLGITLDLGRPAARALCLELVRKCDIVMENFTPRVMENWGLGYDVLKRANPGLVMVSLSGFGHSGPRRDSAALGSSIHALSGLTCLTSYPGGPPQGPGFAFADHISGLYAALAALSALRRRDATGRGARVEISELEAACSLLGPELLDCAAGGRVPVPCGNADEWGRAAPHGIYSCSGQDRWCAIAVFTDAEWQALRAAMGDPPWALEQRFATLEGRLEHRDALDALIGQWTGLRSPRETMELLQSVGVPAAAVNSARDLDEDPSLQAAGFFVPLSHPVTGGRRTDACPVRLQRTPARHARPAPALGADNRYVFIEVLGMCEEEYRRCLEAGIIA
jgi:crotonobetainyl-CoA:carnitine CoA-transferase CaiB-like acyl-CoA transferase